MTTYTLAAVDKSGVNSCEAEGHPSECTEPAPGQIQQTETHNVTVTNASGDSKQLATVASSVMHFDSHAHDHDAENGCHQMESHDIDPDDVSSSLTINGSPIYIVKDAVTTDPTTGGNVNIVSEGVNGTVQEVNP